MTAQAATSCPHDSLSGDEGPVAELGRMPLRWRCDECGAVINEAPPHQIEANPLPTYLRAIALAGLTGQLRDDQADTPTSPTKSANACPAPQREA